MARKLKLNAKSKFSDSAHLVIQLCKTFFILLIYFLFIDNFFNSIKLFKNLYFLRIIVSETVKKSPTFSKNCLYTNI